MRLASLDGAARTVDDLLGGKRGMVVAMASAECPISRKYSPRIAAIEREFGDRVAFVHVNTVDGESTRAIREYIQEFGLKGAYVRDDDGAVRRELRPRTTTEVFVLDAQRRLVYRGAIDDQYRFGGTTAGPANNYLRDAMVAVVAGRSPPVAFTSAPGCLVDPPPAEPGAQAVAASDSITFYPDVSRVLRQHCAGCHFPGGPAPFSLTSHTDVRGRAAMIAAVIREGVMPPNHGERTEGVTALARQRHLPADDRGTILAWLDSAQAIGPRPETAPPQAETGTWAIGLPDLILFSPGPTVAPGDPPTFGRFVVPANFDADRWVKAIECRPLKRDSIELAQVWLLPPGSATPGPGEFPRGAELLATFSRSDPVIRFGDGTARRLPKGSLLVADILARPMSRPMQSQLRIALAFAGEPPGREVHTLLIAPDRLEIPAGAAEVPARAQHTLDRETHLLAVQPLMGPRGRTLAIDLVAPGMTPQRLLELDRYDWRWQIRYPFANPVAAPAGSRIVVTATFDNSALNPANPDATATPSLGMGPDREYFAASIEEAVTPGASRAP